MKLFLIIPLAVLFFLPGRSLMSIEEQGVKEQSNCVFQVLSQRYSGYAYDASKPVTQRQLQLMMEAARLAPSSYNEQPWYFIMCDRTTDEKAYQKALSTLVEANQKWAQNAPVLVVTVAASKSSHNDKGNRHGQYDSGAAAFGMMLEATSLGLMAHQMGGFDSNKARQVFGIPEDCVPMSVMAIGYSLDEVQPKRERKPYSENFFSGQWGKGIRSLCL